MEQRADIREIRSFFASMMTKASRSHDPRMKRAFEEVLREDFLPAGPWQVMVGNTYVETPSADPVYLYQNSLIALDAQKGINNGEPFMHASWIGTAAPQPGETICHVGAGTGYYTAILSRLVAPGRVHAFEIDKTLARAAAANLAHLANVTLVNQDATRAQIPACDLIYVNAGVAAPPLSWLQALSATGRMIMPWRPSRWVGVALLLARRERGFVVKPIAPAWFIPCVGASGSDHCQKVPTNEQAWSTRSAWLRTDRSPDQSATAISEHVWFSTDVIEDRET